MQTFVFPRQSYGFAGIDMHPLSGSLDYTDAGSVISVSIIMERWQSTESTSGKSTVTQAQSGQSDIKDT